MGYYVRAFCTGNDKPKIAEVLKHINSLGIDLHAQTNMNDQELNSNDWKEFELNYKNGKAPILVECNHIRDEEGLAKQEIGEFIEMIEGDDSIEAGSVREHLQNTKYIVACQLPVSSMDDAGYDANGEFLRFFVDHYGGMIHAGGEGFYEGSDILLETD